jgi:hypothetical protein
MENNELLDEGLRSPFSKAEESELYLLKLDLENADIRVRYGSIALYILGAFNGLAGLFMSFLDTDFAGLSSIVIGTAFIIIAWQGRKHGFKAFTLAFTVYMLLMILNVIASPLTLFKGLIWKIIIISVLIGAMKAGLVQQRLREALQNKGLTLEDLRNL